MVVFAVRALLSIASGLHLRKYHFHAMTGPKRNQALRLDRMPRHEPQPAALPNRREQERRFRHGEGGADADTPAAAEGKVGVARTCGGLLGGKPLGVESTRIVPKLLMAVEHPRG